jgi:uncharacterized protein (DUF2252 family)
MAKAKSTTTAATSVSASVAIAAFNMGREPERLALKYTAMASSPFRFLRGACHLFHQRMSEEGLAPEGVPAWICGDLHLENFGTYLGGNGLTYFDINDFEEAARGPHTWDILRLATSVLVAAPELRIKPELARTLVARLIETYVQELSRGKPLWIERRTADGPIGLLIDGLKKRDPVKFLAKRTILKGRTRQMLIDGVTTLLLDPSDREPLAAFIAGVAKDTVAPGRFALVDAARRIAGTGSLGIPRFVLLVAGDGGPDGQGLLDLKATMPSAVVPFVASPQPVWPSEAHRVVAIQTLAQANAPALLSAHTLALPPAMGAASYVLKQLQPSADRLDLATLATDPAQFMSVIETMARLTAWSHLRASGRYGSAPADALIAHAEHDGGRFTRDLGERAAALAQITFADYAQFRRAGVGN